MVAFGKKLLSSRVEEWKEYYIDYGKLKSLIKNAVTAHRKQEQEGKVYQTTQSAAADDDLLLIQELTAKRNPPLRLAGGIQSSTDLVVPQNCSSISEEIVTVLEFRRVLDDQIQKIVLFVLAHEGHLAERLHVLSEDGQSLKSKVFFLVRDLESSREKIKDDTETAMAWNQLHDSVDNHRRFASDLLKYVNFLDTNLTGLRKILKKYDKNFPRNQLSGIYLQYSGGRVHESSTGHDLDGNSCDDHQTLGVQLEKLYDFGGLSVLIVTLGSAFQELHLLELHLLALSDAAKSASEHKRNSSMPMFLADDDDDDFTKAHHREASEGNLPDVFPKAGTRLGKWEFLYAPRRPAHLIPTTVTCQKEPILDQIKIARSRLRQTTKYAELVAAQALFFYDDKDSIDEDKTPASDFSAVQKLSSFLNLISSFLYMTNYYIVAPTVGNYALRLGSDESMSGIIIGMTPNAALIATVLYAFWSNSSYRNALIFASSSSFCGNIFYALALRFNSIHMVMIGRFLVGFGSARSINRRYIADVFSKADRTAASADFVTYAALGMAAGPAAAFAVGHLNFDPSSLLWTNVNAPGWIMVLAWGMFLVFLVLFFEEPERSYLDKSNNNDEIISAISEKERLTEDSRIEAYGTQYTDGETKRLLPPHDDEPKTKTRKEPPLWKNMAVMVSLWMYFILKLVLEMLMSSTSTVTKHYFHWDSKDSGLFMASVGLLMFPVNFFVAKLSQKYADRELIVAALVIMLFSVIGIIDYSPSTYSMYQFIIFGVGIFVSTNGLEGVNMSLLSKTIPSRWARGTFNSGFLATEAGTLARSVGDVLISTVAGIYGMDMVLNGLFTPMALLCAVTIALVYFIYDKLTDVEIDDDDDDDETASANSSNGSALGKK